MCSANSQLSVQLEIICLHAAPFSSVSPEQIQILIFKICQGGGLTSFLSMGTQHQFH